MSLDSFPSFDLQIEGVFRFSLQMTTFLENVRFCGIPIQPVKFSLQPYPCILLTVTVSWRTCILSRESRGGFGTALKKKDDVRHLMRESVALKRSKKDLIHSLTK